MSGSVSQADCHQGIMPVMREQQKAASCDEARDGTMEERQAQGIAIVHGYV